MMQVWMAVAVAVSLPPSHTVAQSPAGGAPPPAADNWGRSRDYDVRHYRIAVAFDWPARTVTGQTTVTARPFRGGLREIELDAADMTVTSVSLANGAPLRYAHVDGCLRVTLDRAYRPSEDISVVIAHTGAPTRGLRFVDSATPESRQIWTVGQTNRNHHWFPSYDAPNDLATVETVVTVPEPYRVIGNGVLESLVRDSKKKVATYHWSMAQPIATYLVSLVVGDFAEITYPQTPPIHLYVPRARTADAQRSLGETVDMMRFFSQYIGVAYPYANYKQTLVREFPGGMENASATTLGESLIYDRRAALDEAEAARLLMAHELAHQWFGNLVTCRDWSEIWLHESFATYFAQLYANHARGDDDLRYALLQAQRRAQDAWTSGNRRPLVTTSYADVEALFDVHAYATGSAVLDMLRFVLGDEPWRNAIRQYLKANAFRNVGTAHLSSAVEESTGQAVDWFFEQWVRNAGAPDLSVSYAYEPQTKTVTVSVSQTGRLFRAPVDIAITTAGGERIHRVWLDDRQKKFAFDVDGVPLIVNFDRGSRLMKQLRFEKPTTELAYQARHDADAMGRIWAALALKASTGPDAESVLTGMLTRDPFWGARVEAARALAGRTGAEVKTAALAGLSDERSAVRRESARLLAAFSGDDVEKALLEVIARDESYYAVREGARALVSSKSPAAFSVLERLLVTPSDKDLLRTAALDLFGGLKDPAGLALTLPYTAPQFPTAVRAAALRTSALLGGTSATARPEILAQLTSALATGPEVLKLAAIDGLERLADPRAIPSLREAAEARALTGPNDALLRRRIRDLVHKLETERPQE